MKIISKKEFEKLNNTVVTVGKFDGLHKGHQKILNVMTELKVEGYESVLFTFKRAPKEVLNKEKMEYILTQKEKEEFLENRGVDYYIEYPCDESVLNTPAEDFVRNILVGKIGAKIIVCGTDFRFGRNREGDIHLLEALQEEFDYELIVLDKLKYGNADISSSRIREAVCDGNIEFVNELLGYNYTVIGKVVHGNEIGRTMGFPTANIEAENNKLLPPFGVYYSRVKIDGKEYKGITNVGKKPTISDDNPVNVETHILGYEGDLYGEILEVEFLKYVRPEMRFDSVETLEKQIKTDVLGCKAFYVDI